MFRPKETVRYILKVGMR